jgi:1-acyl-sn-glycerol-3-phosphate acyltransferase
MLVLRSVVFNTLFYLAFVGLMIAGLPSLLLRRATRMRLVRFWARLSLRLLRAVCGTTVEFRNLHLLPKGAAILAVKHQSFLETIALITVLDDFSYVLKKELTAIPFFGWYLRATGQIGIDREQKARALPRLQQAVRATLAAGRPVIIFPEGTRRPVGVTPGYKAGVAALCAAAQVPCTPVALNTGLFWPRRTFQRRPGKVVIEFLPPIAPGLAKRDFMRALQNAIEPATDALVARALAIDPRLDAYVVKTAPAMS